MQWKGKRRKNVIDKDIYVEDLVKDHPQTVPVLTRYGVICIQCGEPVWGTLGEAIERAGIDDKSDLMEELNRAS
ncbi:DUF1858 domain-containing protein [candidate division LCP-89 bacterium B3_LCP]|uniref:DUF1858 domain-containing protein n=1 Tax=candidate division LCP-89 bacterium B3_LCP TaxID=2012998 RepID=A0A532V281_UNCL8|nr:MAG: DUF1858 domain-containing protein [candidate division LCP-89 bacterium B3_LCP]